MFVLLLSKENCHFLCLFCLANHCFDLNYCDVWGPFNPCTVEGYKYFLTIVDDHSRFLWTYLMRSKSEVYTIIPTFFKQIHTQFNVSIKTLRCDNGSEFSLPSLYNEYGTVVQYYCVETPQ